MSIVTAILTGVAPEVFKTIDKAVLDKDLANKLKAEITAQMIDANSSMVTASAGIITAEAEGESWLQRNWRPLSMLSFIFLIGAYWFGFTPVNMPEASVQSLFTLVQIGLGGYVVGRSVEKTAQTLAPALEARRTR